MSDRSRRRKATATPSALLPPDPSPPATLVVPRGLLRDTHDALLPYWRARVETACFWFGVAGEHIAVATTLALPRLTQSAGHYLVEGTSLRHLAADMRAQGLTNLAQVHTHPATWVGHSDFDDLHAYSTRAGALSLVWPDYGRTCPHDLAGIGVHERQDERWVELDPHHISARIRLVDSLADRRWNIDPGVIVDEE